MKSPEDEILSLVPQLRQGSKVKPLRSGDGTYCGSKRFDCSDGKAIFIEEALCKLNKDANVRPSSAHKLKERLRQSTIERTDKLTTRSFDLDAFRESRKNRFTIEPPDSVLESVGNKTREVYSPRYSTKEKSRTLFSGLHDIAVTEKSHYKPTAGLLAERSKELLDKRETVKRSSQTAKQPVSQVLKTKISSKSRAYEIAETAEMSSTGKGQTDLIKSTNSEKSIPETVHVVPAISPYMDRKRENVDRLDVKPPDMVGNTELSGRLHLRQFHMADNTAGKLTKGTIDQVEIKKSIKELRIEPIIVPEPVVSSEVKIEPYILPATENNADILTEDFAKDKENPLPPGYTEFAMAETPKATTTKAESASAEPLDMPLLDVLLQPVTEDHIVGSKACVRIKGQTMYGTIRWIGLMNNRKMAGIQMENEVSSGHDGKHPTFGYKFHCSAKKGIYIPYDKIITDHENEPTQQPLDSSAIEDKQQLLFVNPVQPDVVIPTSLDPWRLETDLMLGSEVNVIISGRIHEGVVKWIGYTNDQNKPIAGLEMKERMPVCNNGYLGQTRVFLVKPRQGLFVNLGQCKAC